MVFLIIWQNSLCFTRVCTDFTYGLYRRETYLLTPNFIPVFLPHLPPPTSHSYFFFLPFFPFIFFFSNSFSLFSFFCLYLFPSHNHPLLLFLLFFPYFLSFTLFLSHTLLYFICLSHISIVIFTPIVHLTTAMPHYLHYHSPLLTTSSMLPPRPSFPWPPLHFWP